MVRIGTTYVSPAVEAPTIHNVEVCASQDSPVGEGETQAFSCGKMGRYLVVLLEKTDGILTLCEVEVFAKGSHSQGRYCYNGALVCSCMYHTFLLTD